PAPTRALFPYTTLFRSLFGHASWLLNDRMGRSIGARFTDESKTYIYRRRNPDGTLPQSCNGDPHSVNTFPNCVLAGLFNVSGELDRKSTRLNSSHVKIS